MTTTNENFTAVEIALIDKLNVAHKKLEIYRDMIKRFSDAAMLLAKSPEDCEVFIQISRDAHEQFIKLEGAK
jgi:hypothetical protein